MTNDIILNKALEKYRATIEGDVYSLKTGKLLKPGTYNNGYKYISVYIGNHVTKKVKVHRLVATIHIPNPENKPHINHKDANPSNNHIDNLEWCTQKENVIHGFEMGREQWNKGKLSKSQIFRLCKRTPRRMFWILTTNNFQLAKAFWGEAEVVISQQIGKDSFATWEGHYQPKWKDCLQQMVLEESPIKYLERFL